MRIAAAGKSNIGIPQSVGKEYSMADKKSGKYKKGGFVAFEKSGKDVEPKGMKEGSKAEEAYDRKQAKTAGYAKGGSVGRGMGCATRGGGRAMK
jgi:hypothetical protein